MTRQQRIESLLRAQEKIRALYRACKIDDALEVFDRDVATEFDAVDPCISRLAKRLARSFIAMAS